MISTGGGGDCTGGPAAAPPPITPPRHGPGLRQDPTGSIDRSQTLPRLGEYISPGLLRILDRLVDTPAEIVTELGETLRQTPLGVALTGDTTRYTGPERSNGYRWFTAPSARRLYAPGDHAFLSRMYAAGLRGVAALRGPGSREAHCAELLLAQSEEFRRVWNQQEIGIRPHDTKRFVHPEVGRLDLNCQRLLDPEQSHHMMVYTAVPGSETYDKLRLHSVIGAQAVHSDP